MIKYIGSKRRLLPVITAAFDPVPRDHAVLDLFSGSARVGHALKAQGFAVTANDLNAYAHTLATCFVQADARRWAGPAAELLAELDAAAPIDGWFTQTYCRDARYFQPANGARIEGMRTHLDTLDLDPALRAIGLTAIVLAADRVDSTVGLQMAWLKSWSARSHNPVELRLPEVLPGSGTATRGEALAAARAFRGQAAYLDPPYNQHKYLGNYHVWETLVRWDQPEVYGKARKRIDCRDRKSPFNSRPRIQAAVAAVLGALDVETVVISFNNEGFLDRPALEALLSDRGHVEVVAVDHPRYVGAKIGIYNPSGDRVGEVGEVRNKELLYIAGEDADRVAAMAAGARQAAVALVPPARRPAQ